MTMRYQNMTDEELTALRRRRAGLANRWAVMSAIPVVIATIFGPATIQLGVSIVACVLVVIWSAVAWWWLRPPVLEALKRELSRARR